MKIIDLLNKIANGEEVPEKIKYENNIYKHIDSYCYYCDETNLILSDRIFAEYSRLNDTVEIIEEQKKIPEKLTQFEAPFLKGDKPDIRFSLIIDQINEIIDYLESKGE